MEFDFIDDRDMGETFHKSAGKNRHNTRERNVAGEQEHSRTGKKQGKGKSLPRGKRF